MPDDLRSPIKHHLVLHRIDPVEGIRRFYSLMIERDLFAWWDSGPETRSGSRFSTTMKRRRAEKTGPGTWIIPQRELPWVAARQLG